MNSFTGPPKEKTAETQSVAKVATHADDAGTDLARWTMLEEDELAWLERKESMPQHVPKRKINEAYDRAARPKMKVKEVVGGPVRGTVKAARRTNSCPADMSPDGTPRFQAVWQRYQTFQTKEAAGGGAVVSKEGLDDLKKLLDDVGTFSMPGSSSSSSFPSLVPLSGSVTHAKIIGGQPGLSERWLERAAEEMTTFDELEGMLE